MTAPGAGPVRIVPADLGIGTLFWRVREAVVVGDALTGRIVLWNPAATRMFGYSAEDAVGLLLETLVPAELREAHRAGLARYAATGTGTIVDRDRAAELPALRRDGSQLIVELSLSALDPIPEIARPVLAIIRDVTERRRAEELRVALAREQAAHAATEERAREAGEQAAVHAELSAAMRALADESTDRHRELAERVRHAELSADVSHALIARAPLDRRLERCAEAIFRRLEAAFVRFWVLDRSEQVLVLRATAGMSSHPDGPYERVPLGSRTIGLIASERRPYLTNAVMGDGRVSDQEWAKREGMIAFAGYPLLVEGDLVGVMAVFAKRPLAESTHAALATVANVIGLAVDRELRDAG